VTEACSTHWRETLEGGDHLGDIDVDVSIILKWIVWNNDVSMWTWFHVAQDIDQWRALVNTVMKLRVQ
jgi:hypothetical protein